MERILRMRPHTAFRAKQETSGALLTTVFRLSFVARRAYRRAGVSAAITPQKLVQKNVPQETHPFIQGFVLV
jgi:hypothetical protein